MGKRNSDTDWERKWVKRGIIDPANRPSQSNGTKPVFSTDWRYEEIIRILPADKRGLLDDLIHSILNPKP